MKYRKGNYLQVSRDIFKNKIFMDLPLAAKWLYFILCEQEHRFVKKAETYFFRSNEDLAKDANLSLATLKKAKKDLKNAGIVDMFKMPKDKNITCYRIK